MTGADRLLESCPGWIADPVPEAQDRTQVHRTLAAEKDLGRGCISVAISAPLDQPQGDHYWLRVDLPGWWERLAHEQANFRAALRFSLEHREPGPGLRMMTGLWVLWGFHGPWVEGSDWISHLLALPERVSPDVRANALSAAGQMRFEQGDVAVARELLQ